MGLIDLYVAECAQTFNFFRKTQKQHGKPWWNEASRAVEEDTEVERYVWLFVARQKKLNYVSRNHSEFCTWSKSWITKFGIILSTPKPQLLSQGLRDGWFWSHWEWPHRFRVPHIPCFSMEAVPWSFIRYIEQRKSSIKASLKYIDGFTREAGTVWRGGVFP